MHPAGCFETGRFTSISVSTESFSAIGLSIALSEPGAQAHTERSRSAHLFGAAEFVESIEKAVGHVLSHAQARPGFEERSTISANSR